MNIYRPRARLPLWGEELADIHCSLEAPSGTRLLTLSRWIGQLTALVFLLPDLRPRVV